jgi:preprotein translocase subunit YajC
MITLFTVLTSAFAQGKSPSGESPGSSFMSFIPIVLMIVIFYFILIRPSQKKEKDRKKMIEAIQKGDKVLTSGGIYGVVVSVKPEENIVILKISDGTKVEFAKSAIQAKVS